MVPCIQCRRVGTLPEVSGIASDRGAISKFEPMLDAIRSGA
jgi:hypothetical protein